MASKLKTVLEPLRAMYRERPSEAVAVTGARTVVESEAENPLRCAVAPIAHPGVRLPVGLHPAVGGAGDAPCPGDYLSAAVVACVTSSIRACADVMGIELAAVDVEMVNLADVRSLLGLPASERIEGVGMKLKWQVEVGKGTPSQQAERLMEVALRGSPVLQLVMKAAKVQIDGNLVVPAV